MRSTVRGTDQTFDSGRVPHVMEGFVKIVRGAGVCLTSMDNRTPLWAVATAVAHTQDDAVINSG